MKVLKFTALLASSFLLVACGQPPLTERLADPTLFEGVSFIGMTVSDPDRSAQVYRTAFGMERNKHNADSLAEMLSAAALPDEKGVVFDSALNTTNAQLQMYRPAGEIAGAAVPVNGPGIAHICFQVDRDLAAYEKFLEAGASVIGDAEMVKLNPLNPVHYAYVHDPDGLVVEVEHVNMSIARLLQDVAVDRRIRHVSLATGDIDRLMNFYQSFLNVEKPRRSPLLAADKLDKVSGMKGSELYMGWMHIGNVELEFVQYLSHPVSTNPEPRPLSALGYNMIMLDVVDLQAAKKRFVEAGGQIVADTVAINGSAVVLGRDPDQNLVGLGQFGRETRYASEQFQQTF